jgi:hypothetical protein
MQCSLLIQYTSDVMLNHWFVAALHGVLRGCAVLHGHWIYVEMKVIGNTLQVACWDGLDHQARQQIWDFAETARQVLVVRTLVVSFNAEFFLRQACIHVERWLSCTWHIPSDIGSIIYFLMKKCRVRDFW